MEREAAILTAVKESRSEREAGRMFMAFDVEVGVVEIMLGSGEWCKGWRESWREGWR